MRISKSLLVAAAMLATAGTVQAQQNVTQAFWVGAAGDGGAGIWDRWNTPGTAHNYWAARTPALMFTVAANGAPSLAGSAVVNTTNTTGLVVGQFVTGTGVPANSYITAIAPNASFTISNNLTADAIGNYLASPRVSGDRLTSASTLTFNYGLPGVPLAAGATNDILVDSTSISSQNQTLLFTSSGYRLLPGAFASGLEPLTTNFRDIDLARTVIAPPYTNAPNGTLQVGTVTFNTAGIAGPLANQPFLTLRNPTSFGGAITATNANTTINLESFVASTISGTFRGLGNINKTGGGVIQYQGFTGQMFNYGGDTRPYSYVITIFGPQLANSRTPGYGIRPLDLAPRLGDFFDDGRLAGLQGQLRVDGGLLMVSGHVNMWHDFGKTVDGLLAPTEIPVLLANIIPAPADQASLVYALAKRMTGVSSVVLNGSAELSLTNTPVNVGNLRLNFLRNLQAGENNDQFQTTVTTGPDANYRLGIHIDQGFVGSVGILAGSGKVIKTGAGTLRVLNDSRMTGDFVAAGGRTILASATGLTFANSSSFNIAGTQDNADFAGSTATEGIDAFSRRGQNIRYQETPVGGNDPRVDYRPALFPDTGTVTINTNATGQFVSFARTGAEVVLAGDQTVRNFQADFALQAKGVTNIGDATTGETYTAADAVRTAADDTNRGELVITGTGKGSSLFLDGNTLTINQAATGRDGFYNGSIFGADLDTGIAGGRIIKTGGGTLVLLLENGAYDFTEIQGGTFIANVQGLGQKEVLVGSGGTFTILQNNAGTLVANIAGAAGSTLKLVASATIDNGSGAKIEVNAARDPGQVDIVNAQAGFFGNILVNDGVNLSFSGGTNNTFVNASSVTLNSSDTRESVLNFGDTSQLVRNLTGDSLARIELGRGDITLEQNSPSAVFLGSITGVGSFIKQGTASFTLVGATSAGTTKDSYYGATIVRPGGQLVAGTANAIPNTSALILVGTGSFNTNEANQIVGGLFGSSGSTLNIGNGVFTVGYSPARAASLATDLIGANPLLADYLGTTQLINPLLNIASFTATGGAVGTTTITTAATTGLAIGQIVTGTGIAPGTLITGLGAGTVTISNGLLAVATGTVTAAPTLTFTPTSGTASSTLLTATSSAGMSVGQVIIGTGIAPSSFLAALVPNTSFTIAAGAATTATLKSVSSNGLAVGQFVTGTGIPANTEIISITPNTTFTATAGAVGTRVLSTPSTAGLAVGQILSGVGIPANTTVTAFTATSVTISASLTKESKGIVTVGALIGLSNALTATSSGTATVSALLTLNNALVANLAAVPVNLGTVRSIDVTALGLTAAELNTLYTGNLAMPALTNRYLATVAVGTNIGNYSTTGINTAFTATTSFDGELRGTGTLLKAGAETLFLKGTSPNFTGQIQITGGTLDMAYNSLAGAASITVGTGANLAVTVADLYNPVTDAVKRTLTTAILGAGNFVKNGQGYLILNSTLATGQVSYSGTTTVNAGWLEMKALATNGAAIINDPSAHLVLTTATDVTYAGLVSGTGQLEIRATNNATLTAGGSLTHTGGTLVRTGTLLAQNGWAGATTGTIIVEAGATARLNVATNLTASGVFSGQGFLVKEGAGSLTLTTPTTTFSGVYDSYAGTTVLAAANLFGGTNVGDAIAAINLRGNSVLNVTANQIFRNLGGEATTQIAYGTDGVTITLPIDTGATNSFAGLFTRTGTTADARILKTGLGTLNLSPTSGNNALTDIEVQAGRLVGTVAGYSGAAILVGAGAEVAFNAPTLGVVETFNNSIAGIGGAGGTGSVVKTGAGEAILGSINLATNTPDFRVEAGILTLTDSRVGTLPMLLAAVSSGATFRVNLAASRTLATEITGTGTLNLQAADLTTVKLVTVTAQPTVTTTNIGAKVRLDVSAITAVSGITADTGSFLQIGLLGAPSRTLTLTQNTSGVFNGIIEGDANFTLQGPGLFRYANDLNATSVGTVTVDGGFLGVNADNQKSLTLNKVTGATDTRLGVFVASGTAVYTGALVGIDSAAAQMIKLGAGTLDLTSGVTSSLKGDIIKSYDVREGTLAVTLEDTTAPGKILPNSAGVARAVTLSGGTLALSVGTAGGTLLSGAGSTSTGNLAISTIGVGTSTLNVLGSVSGNVSVDGGTILNLGTAGAALLNITGNLSVTGGSTLTGAANVVGNLSVAAGANLAPGFSPAPMNVTGNFTLAGTANMEVSGDLFNGFNNDSVNFSGTANLTGSTVVIERWNAVGSTAAPAFGQRFVLFQGTSTPPLNANVVATYFTGTAPTFSTNDTLGRYLVVSPAPVDAGAVASAFDGVVYNADGLARRPNEYAVYAVRAPGDYALPGVDAGIVAYAQAATAPASTSAPNSVYVPGVTAGPALTPLGARLLTMTNAQLSTALLSLQPQSLAAIPASIALGQRAEASALLRRFEMRRYDRAGYSVYNSEGFALATSARFQGGAGSGSTPFNSTVTGAMGGLLRDLNPWSVAGFSAGFSQTSSNLTAGGASAGSITGSAYRLTGFFSTMLGERKDSLFFDAGLSIGSSTNKSTRTTFLGTESASPKANSLGGFARFGAGYATKAGVSFAPYVGLDFAQVSAGSFAETGTNAALSVDKFSYTSARGTVGTGMTWLSVGDGETLKFSLEFEAFAELGGGQTADLSANLQGIGLQTPANVAAGSGFRIAPSFTYGPNPDSAYYVTLSLEKAGSTQTTGLELGYRRRF